MGRKKTVAVLDPASFREFCDILGKSYVEIAAMIGRSPTTVSNYARGIMAVPEVVGRILEVEIGKHSEAIMRLQASMPSREEMAAQGREAKKEPHRRKLRRDIDNCTDTLKPYRMRDEHRARLYLKSLAVYSSHIKGVRGRSTNMHEVRECDLELADLKAMASHAAGVAKGTRPYNVFITVGEWGVASRALRHLDSVHGETSARALYQHWRQYKDTEYLGQGKYKKPGSPPTREGLLSQSEEKAREYAQTLISGTQDIEAILDGIYDDTEPCRPPDAAAE